MIYLFLGLAIISEVVGTTALAQSDGFSRPLPSVLTVVAYAASFYFLSLTLRSLPTGVVYAIWSGAGIMLIALAAWLFKGQKLDLLALLGMSLILLGVVILSLFSKAGAP